MICDTAAITIPENPCNTNPVTIKISKTIDSIKKQEEYMDSYTTVEEYLKICERFNIKYNKHINLINPNVNQIIKTIWEIKEKEYTENPKYDTKEIKKMIKELTN